MTARANLLTDHVNEPGIGSPTAWTAPAREVRIFIEALGRLGYDTDPFSAWADASGVDYDDPDARVPCELFGALISRAQQSRFTPNLGLELARVTPIGAYPLLDYLVLTSDSVAEGTRQLARYMRLVGNPVVIEVHDDADPIRVELGRTAAPFGIEYSLGLMVLHFRTETDGRFAALSVSVEHEPDDRAAFERVLGCPTEARAPSNSLAVSRAAWRLPLSRRDPVLRSILQSHADEVLARVPAYRGVARDVQRALAARVAGGDTRIESVARELVMSSRTLQRRLASEGVSYQQLLDDARREAAGRYLADSTLAISEVAYLLGYSEPAPFHRAFKRWFGVGPREFRSVHRERSRTRVF